MVFGCILFFLDAICRFIALSLRPIFHVPSAKVTSCLTLVLLICFQTVLLSTVSDCTKSFYIHWNTTNPIFRIDNTDHIIDVNKGNIPFEYDQVNIICPTYSPGTHEEDAEKYIIYNVSKEEYESCRITNPNPRIIAVCDKPYKLMYFTITFRSFTPQPGGLEFQPGQDYYFISTSSKEDLHRRVGGRCSSEHMKVVFKVCCRPEDTTTKNTAIGAGISGNNSVVPYSSTTALPTRPRNFPSPKLAPFPTYPTLSSFSWPSTKKSKVPEKHPNEVLKNEELTYSHGVTLLSSTILITSIFLLVDLL